MNDKLQQLGKLAEFKFVEELKSLESIAKELDISSRTLRSWKEKLNWDSKKEEKLKTMSDISQKLYQTADKILQKFITHLEDPEKQPCISELEERILRDALSKLPSFSKYEQNHTESVKKKKEIKNPKEKLNEILDQFI